MSQRQPSGDLVHHSDRGSSYLSILYAERLAKAGIDPSVGSMGNRYDNALAENTIGYITLQEAEESFYETLKPTEKVA